MLKALELVGFKSFADKTRFEFPEGITVIVGPNGSGKSNIVDAIKWVLGEQSAKSLRGKDMADVIFKGTGTGGRKVMNTAEATIVIDNAQGRLQIDSAEVRVTRRVYRSGEGEYLINNEPCRLRDVRDLFRGTGVGTDAYSLIEQGKVDQLLQASSRDRRAIFEEAAGISRFKAKKIEAQRRLERVDQNLLRLSDIVEEVEGRLKRIRSQAAKARRYREYNARLQELRTQVGLTDWRHLTDQLDELEAQREHLQDEAARMRTQMEVTEAGLLESETQISTLGEEIRNCESQSGRVQEQIASRHSSLEHHRKACSQLEQETGRCRAQLSALKGRAGDVQLRLDEVEQQLAEAEGQYNDIAQQLDDQVQQQMQLGDELELQRAENQQRRDRYVQQMREAVNIGNQVEQLEQQQQRSETEATQCRRKLDQIEVEASRDQEACQELRTEQTQLAEQLETVATRLETAQLEIEESRRVLARRQEELAAQRGRYSGVSERASLLEELQQRREGVGAGVQQVLEQAEKQSGWLGIHGLVSDLLEVDVKYAALVDAALGVATQFVVVDTDDDIEKWRSQKYKLDGRVGFVALAMQPPAERVGQDLTAQPGVIGRADKLVQVDAKFTPLATHLLGTTWFVERWSDVLRLHGDAPGAAFVTLAGEMLRDGVLIMGPKESAEGLVSRRSALQELHRQLAVLRGQIDQSQAEILRVQENLDGLQAAFRRCRDEHDQLQGQESEVRVRFLSMENRLSELRKRQATIDAERQAAEAQQESAGEKLRHARLELKQVEYSVAELEESLAADDGRLKELEEQLQERATQATAFRVERAKAEQVVASLRAQSTQFRENQRERNRALQDAEGQLSRTLQRRRDSERAILEATSALAELFLGKEGFAAQAHELVRTRDEVRQSRTDLTDELQKHRHQLHKLEAKQHKQELAAGEVRHQRETLIERLRDDYGIEISELANQDQEEAGEREAVEQEITDLRRKINSIGAVNMEALDELDNLEQRYESLSGQYDDLVQAKEALERIIHKINADSRRLFTETLEAIRKNFQTLYRMAFGGGKADLALEEGVDVLEAGIEIIATPPGKPSFNNSLLSGGERALTAVSLLLAIFQYRPSPFCVLDEVDAPFDEANIGRFIDVLKDFLGWTKFVIVTHSKKTMTAANTLYGVTMQESGVSKQVSVCFDDVSEDGHIRSEALERDAGDAA